MQSRKPLLDSDIFYSNNPVLLLSNYTPVQLEQWFGPSDRPTDSAKEYIDAFLNDLWRKYKRIDLIKWDMNFDSPFHDYSLRKFISLKYLEDNFGEYPVPSLHRLKTQLEKSINRWNNGSDLYNRFLALIRRIENNEKVVMSINSIITE